MDFQYASGDQIAQATTKCADAQAGDLLVATRPFTYGDTDVPYAAMARLHNGNIVEVLPADESVNGYSAAVSLDDLDEFGVRAVSVPQNKASDPDTLSYPAGTEVETGFVPDVLDRSVVEEVIREYAYRHGYPERGRELIGLLPRAPKVQTVTVVFEVVAQDHEEGRNVTYDALYQADLGIAWNLQA